MRQAALRTPGADERARRLLRAVELELAAGYPSTAQEWLRKAEPWLQGQREQAWALRLERAVRYARGDLNGTASLLLDAAGRLASRDSSLARETFLEAFQAALCAGRLAGQARATAAQITADSSGGSQGAGLTHVLSAMGLLEIGLGNYKSAVANLLPVYEEDLTYLGCWSLPDSRRSGLSHRRHQPRAVGARPPLRASRRQRDRLGARPARPFPRPLGPGPRY